MDIDLAVQAAEHDGFTYEFAHYWADVYQDTRGDEATITKFLIFLQDKANV